MSPSSDREQYPSDAAPSTDGGDPAARDASDESQVQNTRPERPAPANKAGDGMANDPQGGRPVHKDTGGTQGNKQ